MQVPLRPIDELLIFAHGDDLFEGRGNGGPVWEPSGAVDKQWEPFETPAFIRRTKHSSMRKTPHEIS